MVLPISVAVPAIKAAFNPQDSACSPSSLWKYWPTLEFFILSSKALDGCSMFSASISPFNLLISNSWLAIIWFFILLLASTIPRSMTMTPTCPKARDTDIPMAPPITKAAILSGVTSRTIFWTFLTTCLSTQSFTLKAPFLIILAPFLATSLPFSIPGATFSLTFSIVDVAFSFAFTPFNFRFSRA